MTAESIVTTTGLQILSMEDLASQISNEHKRLDEKGLEKKPMPTEVRNLRTTKSNDCNKNMDPYPLDVYGATGGVLMEKYIFLCGGLHNNTPTKECHSINGKFSKQLSMIEGRAFSASIVFNSVLSTLI